MLGIRQSYRNKKQAYFLARDILHNICIYLTTVTVCLLSSYTVLMSQLGMWFVMFTFGDKLRWSISRRLVCVCVCVCLLSYSFWNCSCSIFYLPIWVNFGGVSCLHLYRAAIYSLVRSRKCSDPSLL